MRPNHLAILTALVVLAVPHAASADDGDLRLEARVARSTGGASSLIVNAVNPSRLDLCLVYLPGPSNVSATRRGRALRRGPVVQVRPAMGCHRIAGGAELSFAIDLADLYPQGLKPGTKVCTTVIWRYATPAMVLTQDERSRKVCAVTR